MVSGLMCQHILFLSISHTHTVSCFLPLPVYERFVLHVKSFMMKTQEKQAFLRLARVILKRKR